MNSTKSFIAATLAVLALSSGSLVFADDKASDCGKAGNPEQIEGKVVKVDASSNKITVKGSDGTTHVFQASKETLKDYKEGDTLKAKLRCSK